MRYAGSGNLDYDILARHHKNITILVILFSVNCLIIPSMKFTGCIPNQKILIKVMDILFIFIRHVYMEFSVNLSPDVSLHLYHLTLI